MKTATTAARLVLGLGFTIFGLNGFFNFMPQPKTPMPEGLMALVGAFMKSGYMFPLIFGTQLTVGLLLLSGFFVPLALALIAPVIVNIICLHAFLQPSGIGPGLIVLALELFLAWRYRDAFKPMLQARARPRG